MSNLRRIWDHINGLLAERVYRCEINELLVVSLAGSYVYLEWLLVAGYPTNEDERKGSSMVRVAHSTSRLTFDLPLKG